MARYNVTIGFNNRGNVGEKTYNVEGKKTQAQLQALELCKAEFNIHSSVVAVIRCEVIRKPKPKTVSELLANLDDFTKGYIECALWSSNDESDDSGGDPLDKNYDETDISRECLEQMIADCTKFQTDNATDLEIAYPRYHARKSCTSPDAAYAGHDFWLTRNGHGAGFWDGDLRPLGTLADPVDTEHVTPGDAATFGEGAMIATDENTDDDLGDRLTAAAKKYGEVNLYVSRKKIYC